MSLVVPLAPPASGLEGVRVERVGIERYAEVQALNRLIFGDDRVLFRLDRDDLVFLLAMDGETPVAFKAGYAESATTFYSAKGGVLQEHRRRGIARLLLDRLVDEARAMGYRRFAYDTFPNKHPGMTVMGLAEGFRVTAAGYNAAYRDYRLRFERRL